jgi:ankyrin repeat protein
MKKRLARRSLPSQKARISVDWLFVLFAIFTLQPLIAMEPSPDKRPRTGQSDEFSETNNQTTIVSRPPEMPLAQELILTGENLLNAAKKGNATLCESLIDRGVAVDAQDSLGKTVLMHATKRGYKKVCKLLIARGANVNAQDVNGKTVLMYAADEGHKSICTLLIDQNADVNRRNINARPDGTIGNWAGIPPLSCAALEGHTNVCKLLIARGANIDSQDVNFNGLTALMNAAGRGHKKVCELLIQHNANVDAQNRYNWTALMFAALHGHDQICKLLLEHGANPNALDDEQLPILFNCIKSEESTDEQIHKCVEILLKHGADVNLLSNGRPIDYSRNAQNEESTVLMEAISWGPRELCELLLQWGADYKYETIQGESAITRAMSVENFEGNNSDHMVTLLTDPAEMHAVMIKTDNPLLQRRFGNDSINLYYAFLKRELGEK